MWCDLVSSFTNSHMEISEKPEDFSESQKKFMIQMVQDELEEFEESDDMVGDVDAIADIIYYLLDCCVRNGIQMDPIFCAVHKANMRKFDRGVIKDSTGKVVKPEGWYGPEDEIKKILMDQGYNNEKE